MIQNQGQHLGGAKPKHSLWFRYMIHQLPLCTVSLPAQPYASIQILVSDFVFATVHLWSTCRHKQLLRYVPNFLKKNNVCPTSQIFKKNSIEPSKNTEVSEFVLQFTSKHFLYAGCRAGMFIHLQPSLSPSRGKRTRLLPIAQLSIRPFSVLLLD